MEQLFFKLEELLDQKKRILVAIDGPSASGKSTLGKLLEEKYNFALISMDYFFLQPNQRTEARLEEVGGNVDYERVKQEVTEPFLAKDSINYQIYDCQTQSSKPATTIEPTKSIVIEGCYSFHPSLIDAYDLKIFLEIPEETQLARILERNGPVMQKRFQTEWIPLENKYFQGLKIKEQADLILPYIDL